MTESDEFAVLIVDDDPSAVDALSRRLRGMPHTVRTAVSGSHALAMMREQAARIVITDLMMPAMDGVELTRRILGEFPDTRVIMLTGVGDMDTVVDAMRAGAVDFLQKPIDAERLKRSLDLAAGRFQAQLARPSHGESEKTPALDLGEAFPQLKDRVVNGYKLLRVLGQGCYGDVHLCERLADNRLFAMKIIRRRLHVCGKDHFQRFVNEANAISRLNHPNIIRFIENGDSVSDDVPSPYFVMEYFKSEPLRQSIMTIPSLSLRDKTYLIKQAASALEAVHAIGIHHRDIKPDNLLVNNALRLKISDFGVCRLPNSELKMSGILVGSPAYLAPEYMCTGHGDARVDLYALGVVAYELISGSRPYLGNSLGELVLKVINELPSPLGEVAPGIPPSLEKVVMRMIEKSPERRQRSAAEVIAQLSQAENKL